MPETERYYNKAMYGYKPMFALQNLANPTQLIGQNFVRFNDIVSDKAAEVSTRNQQYDKAMNRARMSVSYNSNKKGITVLDFAGNEILVSVYTIYVDNTKAVSTSISVGVVKQGEDAILAGTGFKNGAAESTIQIGGQSSGATTFTYTVDSGTQITITGGSGDINDGEIVVTDPAGNVSTTNKKLTVDNTKPSVSSVGTATIKNGATSVITGSGFFTQVAGVNDGTDVNITVGGSTPAGMTWVVNSNTQITITAGAGEVTEENIEVYDRAGNGST